MVQSEDAQVYEEVRSEAVDHAERPGAVGRAARLHGVINVYMT